MSLAEDQSSYPAMGEALEEAGYDGVPPHAVVPWDHPLAEPIVAGLRKVYDPEIPVNIFELGLIYRIDIDDAGKVAVDMTLTAPGCPVAGEMPGMVERAIRPVEGVEDVTVEMTFDPPWTPDMMAETAKLQLNLF